MELEQQQLASAIAALEAQRELLGAAVVDTALAPLRERLAKLTGRPGDKASESKQTLRPVSYTHLTLPTNREV